MNEFIVVALLIVLVTQFSMLKWELLALQRRGRPLWLALLPVVSLVVIGYDAIAGRLRRRR